MSNNSRKKSWWAALFGESPPRRDQPRRIAVEELESRCLLTGGASLDWEEVGPFPQINPVTNGGVSVGEATTGRVTSLAFGKYDDLPALFLGSASGGVWRSTTYADAAPVWQEIKSTTETGPDNQGRGYGLITTGSIATHDDHVYVGTGEANFSPDSRHGGGIMSSNDGENFGAAFGATNANEFLWRSISKVLVDPTSGRIYASVVKSASFGAQDYGYGIFQSADNGQTWSPLGGLPVGAVVTDLDYTVSGNTFRLFVAAGNPFGNSLDEASTSVPAPWMARSRGLLETASRACRRGTPSAARRWRRTTSAPSTPPSPRTTPRAIPSPASTSPPTTVRTGRASSTGPTSPAAAPPTTR